MGHPINTAHLHLTHTFTPGLNIFGEMWGQTWNTEWVGDQGPSWDNMGAFSQARLIARPGLYFLFR